MNYVQMRQILETSGKTVNIQNSILRLFLTGFSWHGKALHETDNKELQLAE